jgi:uncharacterized membrane protein (DUF373 family)
MAKKKQAGPMEKKPYILNVRFLRQFLIAADDIMHFLVALTLLLCAAFILVRAMAGFLHPDMASILNVLNDVLLVLIVMELMWPIVRFLKREAFTLNPFLYIGIISSIRRILLLEAEHSALSRLSGTAQDWDGQWPVLAEMGANVGIILVLSISLAILSRRDRSADG